MNDQLLRAIIILILGFGLRYWINRRKFNRRRITGLETFSNYEKSVFITFLEWVGKLIAYIFIICGIFLLFGHYRSKDNEEKRIKDQQINSK